MKGLRAANAADHGRLHFRVNCIVGTPFMIGFVSKWNLGSGALQAQQPIIIAVLIVSALLTTGYFFPIVYNAYFAPSQEGLSARCQMVSFYIL